DVGVGSQGVGDLSRALVGVDADDLVCIDLLRQDAAQIVDLLGVVEAVAAQYCDARRAQTQFGSQLLNPPCGGGRVGLPEITDDADAVIQAVGQAGAQHVSQQRLIAG